MLTVLGDGKLFCTVLGAGSDNAGQRWRVVAFPGWMRTAEDFRAAYADFPQSVLVVEPPGFGRSPEPEGPVSPGEMARGILPLLPLPDDGIVLVGHSFGGRLALHLAALLAERVAAVILIAVPLVGLGPPKRPALPYRAVRLARRLRVVSSSFLERARLRYGSPDYRAASPVMRGVLAKAVEETRSGVYLRLAERVCAPLTLVWGDADTEVPYSVALAFAERVGPRCSIEVARGAGHFPHIAQPEVLKRVTLAALGAGRV